MLSRSESGWCDWPIGHTSTSRRKSPAGTMYNARARWPIDKWRSPSARSLVRKKLIFTPHARTIRGHAHMPRDFCLCLPWGYCSLLSYLIVRGPIDVGGGGELRTHPAPTPSARARDPVRSRCVSSRVSRRTSVVVIWATIAQLHRSTEAAQGVTVCAIYPCTHAPIHTPCPCPCHIIIILRL